MKTLIEEIVNTKPYENLKELLGEKLGAKIYELVKESEKAHKEHELDKAEQQLLGFINGKREYSLRELIESMGLTKKEWQSIKNERPIVMDYLKPDEVEEIENKLNHD